MRAGGSRKLQAIKGGESGTLSHESGGRSASFVQAEGRRQRWRTADAPTPAAWRTCLLCINCGEQPLHGARRRFAERLVEVNRLCKLLADEVIVLREFGVAGKCSLDAFGLAAA
jgi:hypothetical protein